MRTDGPEQVDEMPLDGAAAWGTVLLELWEKRQMPERHEACQSTDARNATVMADKVDRH